jgi:hypothetical protein
MRPMSDFAMDFKYDLITAQEVLIMILLYNVKYVIKNHLFFFSMRRREKLCPDTPTFLTI